MDNKAPPLDSQRLQPLSSPPLHVRIVQIQRALEELDARFRDQYQLVAVRRSLLGLDPLMMLQRLADQAPQFVKYRAGRTDLAGATREVLRPPHVIERAGGDCDAWNLGYAGLTLWAIHGPAAGLASVYTPNHLQPRHAVLGATLHGQRWILDLTEKHPLPRPVGVVNLYWHPW